MTAGNGKRVVQLFGEFEIVAIGRTVELGVAAVDDEIGPRRVDMFADARKIIR